MNNEKAIIVKDLHKSFRLPHEKYSGLKDSFVNIFNIGRRGYEVQKVLEGISFEINKGEFFSIVGRNGSGKSTLLKLLAGIYTPDSGAIQVNGSLTPFIELGVGFNPELTGRENVFLNGALLGFSRQEIAQMYDEIVAFAELKRFMDQKLKNYSSGMQVRLAFSIAIRAKGDILLLDEVLAVGDEAFQRKCTEYFAKIKRGGQTVVLVTHNMENVERFCTRALVIDNGKILTISNPSTVKNLYEQLNRPTADSSDKPEIVKQEKKQKNRWGTGKILIDKIKINNQSTNITCVEIGSQVELTFTMKAQTDTKPVPIVIGIAFEDSGGSNISGPNSSKFKFMSNQEVRYKINRLPCNPGRYYLRVALFDQDILTEYDHIEQASIIDVVSGGKTTYYGKIELFGEWNAN